MSISSYIVPFVIICVIVFGFCKGLSLYDLFIDGANDALKTAIKIIAPMTALMSAVSMLRAAGVIDIISNLFSPIAKMTGFPIEVLPFALMRPVSGSASLAILEDIFSVYGPDSIAGRVASVISGSSETTFYALSVYFAATKIKNTRHTLKAALIADFAGMVLGTASVYLFFNL